jgi:hypothetical protein
MMPVVLVSSNQSKMVSGGSQGDINNPQTSVDCEEHDALRKGFRVVNPSPILSRAHSRRDQVAEKDGNTGTNLADYSKESKVSQRVRNPPRKYV